MRSGQWLIGQQFIGTYNYPPSQNVIVAGPASQYIIDAGTIRQLWLSTQISHCFLMQALPAAYQE